MRVYNNNRVIQTDRGGHNDGEEDKDEEEADEDEVEEKEEEEMEKKEKCTSTMKMSRASPQVNLR